MKSADTLQLKIAGVCVIVAPLLFGLSTFFWQNGEYGLTAAVLIIISCILWVPGLAGLFGLLKYKMPVYSVLGFIISVYGSCVGGASFAFLGYFSTMFHISHQDYISNLGKFPISSGLLLFWAGPLFPLSLLLLGVNLLRKKILKKWLGLMICVGSMFFPFGRILRAEWIAHITDLLFAIPFAFIGYEFIAKTAWVMERRVEN